MNIELLEYPNDNDWLAVKERALVTVGKHAVLPPTEDWKHRILEARHSPIRYLRFSFFLEDIPYWCSVHICRHVHLQPFCRTQRNDRQKDYDRNKAPQDSPVNMIIDLDGEMMMILANKRLCLLAAPETREIVKLMCNLVEEVCPEFHGLLVPSCEFNEGRCHEMFPCGRQNAHKIEIPSDIQVIAEST